MTQDRVMLLIDADNVSVDIMEQAIERLLADYGALHVRRAYCTAESAVKHQGVFKRLGIKPMVNLAAGKNSTDIALAVDALDLVLAERPDVVVIASSDSDFAPLVGRLREKGCRVRGIGQKGKTGDETLGVYDEFTVLAHRKAADDDGEAPTSGRRRAPARKTAARKEPAARKSTSTKGTSTRASSRSRASARADAAAGADTDTDTGTRADVAAAAAAASTDTEATTPSGRTSAAKKAPARKTAARKVAAKKAAPVAKSPARKGGGRRTAAAATLAEAVLDVLPPAASPRAAVVPPPQVAELLRALPELARGERLEVQRAAEELRKANLLSKRSSVPRLLGRFPDWFELHPPSSPKWIHARTPGDDSTHGAQGHP